ncbi:MAG: leucine-rich repeat domain-containing protein [Clostridia bacterium]|nr:leucine-rich repeat domain-containing protein [Clostridia bacterium]
MKSVLFMSDGKKLRIGDFFYKKERGEVTLVRYAGHKSRVTVPEGVALIADECFSDVKTKEVVLPEGVREIGRRAFYCSAVKKVSLPASVKTVGSGAFDCSGIESLSINNPNVFFYPEIFDHAYDLKEISFAGTIDEWEKIFEGQTYSATFSVRFSDGTTKTYQ